MELCFYMERLLRVNPVALTISKGILRMLKLDLTFAAKPTMVAVCVDTIDWCRASVG